MLEERKERDHRKIGKELELFSNNQLVGAGLPYGCLTVLQFAVKSNVILSIKR